MLCMASKPHNRKYRVIRIPVKPAVVKAQYDSKLFRLIRILNRLDSGKPVHTKDLAQEFNISTRSVQRDISFLAQAGFPIFEPSSGEHKFTRGYLFDISTP